MITYELALQLKNAGFPSGLFSTKENVYFPTLSELIEVCEKDDDEFILIQKDKWVAGYFVEDYGEDSEGNRSDYSYIKNQSEGATPEEAVANLYLQINSK
jgi:hypothetical protein